MDMKRKDTSHCKKFVKSGGVKMALAEYLLAFGLFSNEERGNKYLSKTCSIPFVL